MKISTLIDLIHHEPAKSAAWGLICIALVLVGLELIHGLEGNAILNNISQPVSFEVKPKRTIDENAEALKGPLFGLYVPVNLSEANIKQSTLDLEVVGILYSSDEKASQVLIKAAGGQEAVYSINDSLPGGVLIKRINAEGVIVLHNGVLESLDIKKYTLKFEAAPKPLLKD